jgi:hypothetical protein
MEISEVSAYRKRRRLKSKKNLIKSLVVIDNYGKSEVFGTETKEQREIKE